MPPSFDSGSPDGWEQLADQIIEQNDLYRRSCNAAAGVLWDRDTFARDPSFQDSILDKVRGDEMFDPDSCPWHDWGKVVVNGERFTWEIVYLDDDGVVVLARLATRRGLSITKASTLVRGPTD